MAVQSPLAYEVSHLKRSGMFLRGTPLPAGGGQECEGEVEVSLGPRWENELEGLVARSRVDSEVQRARSAYSIGGRKTTCGGLGRVWGGNFTRCSEECGVLRGVCLG